MCLLKSALIKRDTPEIGSIVCGRIHKTKTQLDLPVFIQRLWVLSYRVYFVQMDIVSWYAASLMLQPVNFFFLSTIFRLHIFMIFEIPSNLKHRKKGVKIKIHTHINFY